MRHALRGERHRIPELLTDEFLATEKRDPVYSTWAATFYAMLGDSEQALDWLENAVNGGFINYPYLHDYDPFLAKLRGEPRFEKLMERVKRAWEGFEV